MLSNSSQFTGSIVALITPMFDDGSVDFNTIDMLVDWHVDQGTSAIVAVGTTGESATLAADEHLQVVQRCLKAAKGRIPVIAGAGANSTSEAIALATEAKTLGADATLQVVPYYNKPAQHGLIAHFIAIADAVDLPHILYNVPGRTVVDLHVDSTIELAKHPRIIGLKDATGEITRVSTLRDHCGKHFVLLSGDDPTFHDFMLAGGDGVISVTANLHPALMAKLCTLLSDSKNGDSHMQQAAYELQHKLIPTHKDLFIEPSPSPLKWAMHHLGLIPSTGTRLPLLPLTAKHRRHIETLASSNLTIA